MMEVQVSKTFQTQVKKTLFSILIFILVYIILLAVAIGITLSFAYIGIWAIRSFPNGLTIALGIGLILAGLIILYFLLKFIFATNKSDLTDLIEIKKEDQPQLFVMIHELVNEVKTDFPKKVFLSHNVNASVFYDSSFWSMFLPIKKNLQIGVGLINSLTKQELRAILAHEFGHFSQKSMRVGSYVYNVNNIIYNMLYNNASLNKMYENISKFGTYLALPIIISTFSINTIQKILSRLYDYINIHYLALSREMEFHADQIATQVAGSQAMSEGLKRLSFANHSLESVLSFYENKSSENWMPIDIYENQTAVSLFLAKRNKYEIINGFPKIPVNSDSKYNKSKLNIENQWASHPSTEDRIHAIENLNIELESIDNTPALEILKNKETLFLQIKNKLFEGLNHPGNIEELDVNQFEKYFEIEFKKNDFDEIYNEFHTYINPIIQDFSKVNFEAKPIELTKLYSDQNTDLSMELNSLLNDKQTLQDIKNKTIKLKTFVYDGVKYKSNEVDQILEKIESEINVKQELINAIVIDAFESFYQMAISVENKIKLKNFYEQIKVLDAEFNDKIQFYFELSQQYYFVYEQLEYSEINSRLMNNKEIEKRLKREISELLKINDIVGELPAETHKLLLHFANNDLIYFNANTYDDNNLNHLFTSIQEYFNLTYRAFYLHKFNLLNFQKEIYDHYLMVKNQL